MTEQHNGPTLPISIEIDTMKYRQEGESHREKCSRIGNALADDSQHFQKWRDILLPQKFLPAGRVQSAIGSPRKVTAFNCFVSGKIEDSMEGIFDKVKESALTMKKGGGIGYNFSSLRPKGDLIVSLDSKSSGVLSFMRVFDTTCGTVSSAGNRRGAQMGVLNVDHPDIEEFIEAKANSTEFTRFNLSVGVTDEFMKAVVRGAEFDLKFNDRVYKRVDAKALWDKIMRATWDWAEPGILFIDRINEMNNLYYCEEIEATNPCGEQPLPEYGACLLGSYNLVKYLTKVVGIKKDSYQFDWEALKADVPEVVRAMDNVIDNTTYPLKQQELEAKSKRRMGLGTTALANAGEALGYVYGSKEFIRWAVKLHKVLANETYRASSNLAAEKGSFPLFDKEKYCESKFVKRLDKDVQELIKKQGVRNSHLLSIAPTGTISLSADNVSSGCEPIFNTSFERTIQTELGEVKEIVTDYGYRELGVTGKTANELTTDEHLDVLIAITKWVDSAVSKTINVGSDVEWEEFKEIYIKAWKGGCKGATTFRDAGKRYGILNVVEEEVSEAEDKGGEACYYDSATGRKQCE